ncbi:hypothetical protein GOODEAATRI_033852 [Goodea atripinnis]|uniref:Caprin-1 dimerization domain-containing protein n=1 Tax=Goodea atripinnis TaxID=208336 RepID=A0ABV0PTV1_9TELE
MAGLNHAPYIPAHQLQSLNQLAALLGVKRDGLSLEEQMDQAALVYMDLLDGKDKPVAGSTCELNKCLIGISRKRPFQYQGLRFILGYIRFALKNNYSNV